MKFKLTPHVKSILCGRGMCIDNKLLCSAPRCLFEETEYGREIRVKGIAECPICHSTVKYPDDLKFDDYFQKGVPRCPICKEVIVLSKFKWIQNVISKHRGKKHVYMHEECYDALYINGGNNGGEEETL